MTVSTADFAEVGGRQPAKSPRSLRPAVDERAEEPAASIARTRLQIAVIQFAA
jgi:hypothetical protein